MRLQLSRRLYNSCRSCFLECSQFDSHASLKSLFAIGELSALRDGIPEVGSKGERIDALMDYLLGHHP
jgi:hypothetical protein